MKVPGTVTVSELVLKEVGMVVIDTGEVLDTVAVTLKDGVV